MKGEKSSVQAFLKKNGVIHALCANLQKKVFHASLHPDKKRSDDE